MTDINIALVLRFVDRALGPARRAFGQLDQMGNQLGQSGLRNLELADQLGAAQRARVQGLGAEALALGGVVFGMQRLIQPAIDFEAAMDRVGAVSQANDEQLMAMTETAQRLGAETVFSASQAAEGMQFLAMAGFEVNETIAAMPGLLDLASAGQQDLATTSDIASNILTGFGLAAEDMDRVGDILTNTFTTSNTNLSMLGATMSYVAPTARDVGVELEIAAAMAGRLGDAGIQGERAGTALRAMLASLASPSTEAADALEALGIQTQDAQGDLRPMVDILADMDRSLESLGSAGRADALATIFGREAMSAASVLLEQAGSGALQGYIDGMQEAGSAARVAAEQNDNTAGALRRLASVSEALSIKIGTALLPMLNDLLEGLIPIIDQAVAWAEANPELIATIGKVALGLVAMKAGSIALRLTFEPLVSLIIFSIRTLGWLKIALGTAARAVGLIVTALRTLATLATAHPIIALITAIAGGAMLIYQNWDAIVSYFSDKIDRIKAAFEEGLLNGVLTTLAELNPFRIMMDAGQALADMLLGWDFSGVREMIAATLGFDPFAAIYNAADRFFTYITGWSFAAISAALRAAFDIDLYQAGVNMMQSLWEGIQSMLGTIAQGITSALAPALSPSLGAVTGSTDGATSTGGVGVRAGQQFGDWLMGRAIAGPVRAGSIYAINEEGQEFFRPNTSGDVISAADARRFGSGAAGAPRIDVGGINIYPAPGMSPREIARAVSEELDRRSDQGSALHDGGFYA